MTVIWMGPASRIGGRILLHYRYHTAIADVETNAFEDANRRVSPYAEPRNATYDDDFQKTLDRESCNGGRIRVSFVHIHRRSPFWVADPVLIARGTLGVTIRVLKPSALANVVEQVECCCVVSLPSSFSPSTLLPRGPPPSAV